MFQMKGAVSAVLRGDCRINGVLAADFLSCGRSSAFEPCEALEIIHQVGHADLDPDASDVNGADDEAHAVLLPCKDMLDGGTDL